MDLAFFSRLQERIVAVDSLLCVGLDPHLELLTQNDAEGALEFCLKLIEATAEVACAFKPNAAFFEAHGFEGWRVLKEIVDAVPEEIPVILDAKRGDVATTSQAYARSVFEVLGADALTVSPYLGRDAVEPFLADPKRGVFILCRTSNPGAEDFQELPDATGQPLYLKIARMVSGWEKADNVGLVVGATDPTSIQAVRAVAPDLWFLSPGVGAQGADLSAALRAGLWENGMGMIIPVSRGIASSKTPREEASRIRDSVNEIRRDYANVESGDGVLPRDLAMLADQILEAGCVRFGTFTLKSGAESPIYFDLRLLASHPELLGRVAAAYQPLLESLTFDHMAALPYAALPIVTAISIQTGWPMIYPRKETKVHGTGAVIEGVYSEGDTAVLIDDLITTGGSKLVACDRLREVGLKVRDVVVLIDRQRSTNQEFEGRGFRLHAVFTLAQLLDHWGTSGKVKAETIGAVRQFLKGTS